MLQLHWRVVLRDDRTDAANRVVWTGILLRGEIRCHGARDPVLSPRQLLPSRSGTAYSVSKQLIRKSCLVSFCLLLPCLSFRVLSCLVLSRPVLLSCLVKSRFVLFHSLLFFWGVLTNTPTESNLQSFCYMLSRFVIACLNCCGSVTVANLCVREFQSLFDL